MCVESSDQAIADLISYYSYFNRCILQNQEVLPLSYFASSMVKMFVR